MGAMRVVVAAARVAAGEVVVGALVQILHGAGGGAGAGSGGAPASAAGGGGSSAVGGGGSAAAAAAAAAAGEWGIGRPPQYVGNLHITRARTPKEISQTLRPMQRVAMDILGPLPETLRVAMLQPFELMYGRDAHLPEDVLFSIPATAEDPIQYADVLKNRLQLAYKRVNQHMAVQQGH
ncbi:hypothetical protein EMCRGX_G016493 [Ephydatia muelleri]